MMVPLLSTLFFTIFIGLLIGNRQLSASVDAEQYSPVLWNPPTVPVANVFYSPCTFPLVYPFGRRSTYDDEDNVDECHVRRRTPFICDLHRTLINLSHHDAHVLYHIYRKHAPVLRSGGTPAFVVLLVRQLIQPISTRFVRANNSEYGCLFRIPYERMNAESVHMFVRSTKTFLRLYTSALLNRWTTSLALDPHRNRQCDCVHPKVLAVVLLEGLIPNPKRVTAVTLHTTEPRLWPYISNAQLECTNMLLQGFPLIDVLMELTDRVGFALRDFHLTKGRPRRHAVPRWAWHVSVAALGLVLLALLAEWLVVRKVQSHKMRPADFGGIKAVIKSKTHMIF